MNILNEYYNTTKPMWNSVEKISKGFAITGGFILLFIIWHEYHDYLDYVKQYRTKYKVKKELKDELE